MRKFEAINHFYNYLYISLHTRKNSAVKEYTEENRKQCISAN